MIVRKELKKEQILNQGIQLLMRHGYNGTGLKLLLDTVKVPKGSFYSYFESKEKFTAEAITHYIEPFIVRLEFYLNQPELDGFAAIKAYFDSLIDELEQSDFKGGCLLGDMMGEVGSISDLCRLALKAAIERYCVLLERGLRSAQLAGIIHAEIATESMAKLLFDSWQGALLHMKIERSITPLQRFSTELLDHYLVK